MTKDYQEDGEFCCECFAPMIETERGPYCSRVWKVVLNNEPYKEEEA